MFLFSRTLFLSFVGLGGTGFMPGNACLDKDGVRTAALMNELVLDLHRKGVSVQEHLHDLYSRFVGFPLLVLLCQEHLSCALPCP